MSKKDTFGLLFVGLASLMAAIFLALGAVYLEGANNPFSWVAVGALATNAVHLIFNAYLNEKGVGK